MRTLLVFVKLGTTFVVFILNNYNSMFINLCQPQRSCQRSMPLWCIVYNVSASAHSDLLNALLETITKKELLVHGLREGTMNNFCSWPHQVYCP